MVPGTSIRELIPESPNPKEDGISQIVFAQLFKEGVTEYTHVGAGVLKSAPPLPTGYVLFKDLVYQVKTDAILSGLNITVFNLPSADNEMDFNRLAVLHLEDDEMSPSGKSWQAVTLFPETADARAYLSIPKAKYDSFQPDFKTRLIAGVTNKFGLFVIAVATDIQAPLTGPFTTIEVQPSNTPEPVRVGDEVTQVIVVKNKGPKPAAEVNLKEEFDPDLTYMSATSDYGACKSSNQSSGRVLCYLGPLPVGATATIRIVLRVKVNLIWHENETLSKSLNVIEMVFKEKSTDFVVSENQIITEFTTSIIRDR